jgi:hypothetical protein
MSWLSRLKNHMRQEAQRATAQISMSRWGIVQNYDPARHAARVLLMPEEILTGYLPVGTQWIGDYAPPNINDLVEVHFQQGSKGAGYIGKKFYSAQAQPIPVPSGERWIVHSSGSFIKFTNAGDVIISAARDLVLHGGSRYIFDANGQGQIWNGSNVETWQDNDSTGGHHDHAPPEIPT